MILFIWTVNDTSFNSLTKTVNLVKTKPQQKLVRLICFKLMVNLAIGIVNIQPFLLFSLCFKQAGYILLLHIVEQLFVFS